MAENTTATPSAETEPEINDAIPANAEIASDAQIDALLARFGIGPQAPEDHPPTTSPPAHVINDAPAAAAAQSPSPAAAAESETSQETRPAEPATPPPTPSAEDIAKAVETHKAEWTKAELEPLRSERDEARALVETLQDRLQQMTSPAPMPPAIDPLLIEDDFTVLAQQEREATQLLNWCDQNEDTGYQPQKEGEAAWTPADVRKLRRALERKVNQLIPQARDLAQTRSAKRAEARTAYPELFDAKHEHAKIRAGLYAKAPWLRAVFPQFDLWLGHMLAGEKIFSQRGKSTAPVVSSVAASSSGAPQPPTRPPVRPSPGGPPLATSPNSRATQPKGVDVAKFIEMGGTRSALIDLIKSSNL